MPELIVVVKKNVKHSLSAPTAQLGWHSILLEFHHLFKQQEGPDTPTPPPTPANKVRRLPEFWSIYIW